MEQTALKVFFDTVDALLKIRKPDGSTLTINGAGGAASSVAAGDGVRVTTAGTVYTVHGVRGACSLEQYGAVGDGTTSDQTAMASAITALGAGTYKAIILGAGKTYLVTGTHTVPAGCAILGHGSSGGFKTATNAAVLRVGGENVTLRDFDILGNATGAAQHGIVTGDPAVAASGFARAHISGVTFTSLGGDGYQYNQNPFLTFAGPRISDCFAKSCIGAGFRFGTRGEYVMLSNCGAESCGKGAVIGAGNVTWSSGDITSNTTGIELAAGVNDAHGIFSGLNVNHNTTNLVVGAITLGHTFAGCHFYEGPIQLTSCQGVHFANCVVDVTSYTFNGSLGTRFDACTIGGSYTNTITETNSPTTSWIGSKTLTGTQPAWLGRRQVGWFGQGEELFAGTDSGYTAAGQASSLRLYVKSTGYGYLGVGTSANSYWDSLGHHFQLPIDIEGGTGTMASTGLIRTKGVVSSLLRAGSATLLAADASNGYVGTDSSYANQVGSLRLFASSLVAIGLGSQNAIEITAGLTSLKASGVYGLHVTSSNLEVVLPLKGRTADNKALEFTRISVTVNADPYTLLTSQYSCMRIRLTGTPAADTDVVFPDGEGRWEVRNETGVNVTLRDALSNGVVQLPAAQSCTVSMASTQLQLCGAKFTH